MGHVHSACFVAVAVTAAQDAFSILTPAGASIQLLEITLSQSSDFGDAQDELLPWSIKRGATSAGSGGSAPTISITPNGGQSPASGCTVHANDTTAANTGTIYTLKADAFNVRAGLIWMPTPKITELFFVAPSTRIVLGIAAPADSLTMHGTITWEEFG